MRKILVFVWLWEALVKRSRPVMNYRLHVGTYVLCRLSRPLITMCLNPCMKRVPFPFLLVDVILARP